MRQFLLKVIQAGIVLAVVVWAIKTKQPNAGAAFLLGVGLAIAVTVAPVALYHMILGEIRKRRASRDIAGQTIQRLGEPEPEPYVSLPSKGKRLASERGDRIARLK